MKYDYTIVGSGLTGAVIARKLTDAGRTVKVIERRSHLGGNVHDHIHSSGFTVHTYGPHYFRTNSDHIWQFVNRFAKFNDYQAIILSKINDGYAHWPIWRSEFDRYSDGIIKTSFKNPKNFAEAALNMMPREIFNLFVKEYNEKQWGVPAQQLSADLARRFDVRDHKDPRLKPDVKYQGIPVQGYAKFMESMLSGIDTELECDFISYKNFIQYKCLIYTGPIDLFFGSKFGHLAYRGQRRTHEHHTAQYKQSVGQVNYPLHADGPHIRKLEWKHMHEPDKLLSGTLITTETPFTPTDPNEFEYPFPDKKNTDLYMRYRQLANNLPNVHILGRLGEYKYYDMDQAIARAMKFADSVLCS